MSIASRITSMENNIRNAYHGLDSIGIDTSSTNKNIENISALLDDFYDTLPKISGSGSNIQLTPTLKGRITSQINGDTLQDGTPTPDTPIAIQSVTGTQNITVCRKNLFNKNNIKVGYRFGSTGDYYPNTGYNATNYYINVLPNTTYATSWSISQMECVCLYDKNKNFISRLSTGNYSFTTTNETYFIRADVKDANLETAQIELGSTATTYEAYSGNDYTIHLGDIELFEDDYITGTPDNWSIINNISKSIITNTTGTFSMPSTNRFNIDNAINDYYKSANAITYLSNQYIAYSQKASNEEFNNLVNNENYGFDFSNGNSNTIRIKDTRFNSVDNFKNWLSSNNLKIIYRLATPTTTPITDTTLINDLNTFYYAMSKNGETNISVDGNLPAILDVSILKEVE